MDLAAFFSLFLILQNTETRLYYFKVRPDNERVQTTVHVAAMDTLPGHCARVQSVRALIEQEL